MITLETILKSGYVNDDKTNYNYQQVITNNKNKIFIYDYPISSILKDDFETHFCTHFYKHTIAFQNIGEWCYYLSEHLNNIFPYMNTYFEKISDYNDLMTNLGYNETITISHQETGSLTSSQTGENTSQDNTTSNQTIKGRDFPNSSITVTSGDYYTDSTLTDGLQDSNNESHSSFNQNDNTSKNFNETENRNYINNSDINVYDFLLKYRDEIDNIYGLIYSKMSDLFIAIM